MEAADERLQRREAEVYARERAARAAEEGASQGARAAAAAAAERERQLALREAAAQADAAALVKFFT
jgi:hypothetical protein